MRKENKIKKIWSLKLKRISKIESVSLNGRLVSKQLFFIWFFDPRSVVGLIEDAFQVCLGRVVVFSTALRFVVRPRLEEVGAAEQTTGFLVFAEHLGLAELRVENSLDPGRRKTNYFASFTNIETHWIFTNICAFVPFRNILKHWIFPWILGGEKKRFSFFQKHRNTVNIRKYLCFGPFRIILKHWIFMHILGCQFANIWEYYTM